MSLVFTASKKLTVKNKLTIKIFGLLTGTLTIGIVSSFIGLNTRQVLVISVFFTSVLGTLFFWDFRLGFVFIANGVLFITGSVDVEHFIKFASLDVIIFLIGMMLVVAVMKQSGIFHQVVFSLLKTRGVTGVKLFVIIMVLSAILSALTGEVTSIIVMIALILDICSILSINPVPLVVSSVLTTNIGSASTLIGNPIGVLIALRAGITFEDFLTRALPLSMAILAVAIIILLFWFRHYIKEISSKLADITLSKQLLEQPSPVVGNLLNIVIFCCLIVSIGLHKRFEILLGLEENRLLVVLPILFAGALLFFRCDRVKYCIKNEIEWKSLLFFMFLFAQAGVIQSSGTAQFLAEKLIGQIGSNSKLLVGATLFSSGFLSGILDNTVVVASYIPIVKSLHSLHLSLKPLWWAMLFGACLGGNITAIGSTANIVALGILEKQRNTKVYFLEWFKLGVLVGIISMLIAYFAIAYIPLFSL